MAFQMSTETSKGNFQPGRTDSRGIWAWRVCCCYSRHRFVCKGHIGEDQWALRVLSAGEDCAQPDNEYRELHHTPASGQKLSEKSAQWLRAAFVLRGCCEALNANGQIHVGRCAALRHGAGSFKSRIVTAFCSKGKSTVIG